MDLVDVEDHLETLLARESPGSGPVSGEKVRAVLAELSNGARCRNRSVQAAHMRVRVAFPLVLVVLASCGETASRC